MFVLRSYSSSWRPPLFRVGLLVAILSLVAASPLRAQTTTAQNNATIQVQNGGTWNLENGTMDLGDTGSTARLNESSRGHVTGGTLRAARRLNGPDAADVAGLGAELSASADLGIVTVVRGHAVQVANNGNESIRRYFAIEPGGVNDGLDATLTLHYAEEELNGRSASTLEMFKSTDGGDTWSERGYSSRDADANTVTLSEVSSFSRWTLGSENAPLPVEIASFDATLNNDAAQLTWTTASESQNAGFRVQRRTEEGAWTTIGSVEGNGTTVQAQSYQFTDAELPYEGDRLTYRLKQVDTGGASHLSETVSVERGVSEVELLGTYPNPARQRATVRYALPATQEVDVGLYDVLGQRVRTVVRGTQEGRQEQTLDVEGLSSGVYFLRLRAGRTTHTQRLTIVH